MTTLFEPKMTYDFCDGFGSVPAHRHPNGGGWVAETAKVGDAVYVGPEARIHGHATIRDSAVIDGKADVSGYCLIKDHACIRGNAVIKGTCEISGHAVVGGDVFLSGHFRISGETHLEGKLQYFSEVDCLLCPALLDENYTSGHNNPCLDCLEKQRQSATVGVTRSGRIPVWARLKKKKTETGQIGDKA